jgi:hypothetical protein
LQEEVPLYAKVAGPRWNRLGVASLALIILASVSCAHLPFLKPKQSATEVRLGASGLTLTTLQVEALRFADNYVQAVAYAVDDAARTLGTREAAVVSLKWKLDQATAAYADATGENPVWNALDLTVLATVARMVAEDATSHAEFGEALGPIVGTHRRLEAAAWALAESFLTPEQSAEMRGMINEWRRANPNERSVTGARFREFALSLGKVSAKEGSAKPASLFSMLYLDPFAGLDPTTVAIDQSRELAARVVAYAERAPTLLRWQAELLALQVSQQPAARDLSADIGRTSRSIESISRTAEGIPALVDAQRQAAIDQIFAGVTAQREAMLADLDAREGRMRTLLAQLRETMNAGGQMGESLTGTIKTLDTFVRYVSPPKDPNAPPSTGKPFDPLDYGKAASQVGSMARDLNVLLASAGSTAPEIAKISASAGDDLKRVVDRAFWRGLVLIAVLLVGYVLARLAYRSLEQRMGRARRATDA